MPRSRGRPRGAKNKRSTVSENKSLRGLSSARYKGFRKLGSTNSMYHSSIPRTLQIATRRPMSAVLRFQKNYTIKVSPSLDGAGSPQMTNIQFRANSLTDLVDPAQNTGWVATANTDFEFQDINNDFADPSGTNYQYAEGAEPNGIWASRFAEYTVMGSKISVVFDSLYGQGTTQTTPASCFIQLTGSSRNIQATSQMSDVNKLPYVSRGRLIQSQSGAARNEATRPGCRLTKFYSTRKFENVQDPSDNPQLRGHFQNALVPSPSNRGAPTEASYFNVGYCPTFPFAAGTGLIAPVVMTVRLEYIAKLSEPTLTNQTSISGRA